MPFKDNLKKYRKLAGLTQAELADKMKVSQGTIGNWESGYRIPDITALETLSKILDVSTDDLIGIPTKAKKEAPIQDECSREQLIDLIVEKVSEFPTDQQRAVIDKLYSNILKQE